MADQPQITVNKPFEVFFPEKRPFFLENTAYFNTPIQLLFTRRIADPLVGGRATGRAGAYSAGAMIVDDRSPFDGGAGDAAQLSVVRVMRDVGRESYVGAFASRRTVGGRDNEENLIGALDGRWKLARNWFATGQAAVSEQGIVVVLAHRRLRDVLCRQRGESDARPPQFCRRPAGSPMRRNGVDPILAIADDRLVVPVRPPDRRCDRRARLLEHDRQTTNRRSVHARAVAARHRAVQQVVGRRARGRRSVRSAIRTTTSCSRI